MADYHDRDMDDWDPDDYEEYYASGEPVEYENPGDDLVDPANYEERDDGSVDSHPFGRRFSSVPPEDAPDDAGDSDDRDRHVNREPAGSGCFGVLAAVVCAGAWFAVSWI